MSAVIKALPVRKISDVKLAKLLGLPIHKMRKVIEDCIADGEIEPTEYLVVLTFGKKRTYHVDDHAMLMITARVRTPQAIAAIRDMCETMTKRHPNILEELLGPGLLQKVMIVRDGVVIGSAEESEDA